MPNRIRVIRYRQLLGFDEMELQPGRRLTVITGGNGAGKTSSLEGLKAAIGGGKDETLIRHGEPGSVVVVFESGHELTRSYRPGEKPDLSVKGPDGKKIKRPQEWVDSITNNRALNPIAFLQPNLPMRDRIRWVLEAMPLRVTVEQLNEAGVSPAYYYHPELHTKHALEMLDHLCSSYYDERTGLNARRDSKRKYAAELREAIGEASAPPAKSPAEIQEELLEETRRREHELASYDAETAKCVDACQRSAEEMKVAARAKAARIKALVDAALHRALRKAEEESAAARDLAVSEREPEYKTMQNEAARAVGELRVRLSHAQDAQRRYEEAERSRKRLEEAEQEADGLEVECQHATTVIENLRSLKTKTTETLPVPGLDIREDTLYVDGVHIDRVNRERAVRVAIQLAKLNANPELPLICLDGMECLSDPVFESLVEAASKAELQMFLTRVDPANGPLDVARYD